MDCLRTRRIRRVVVLLLALLAAATVSCSRDSAALNPVRGQVLYKGRPVARAMVVFHPLEGESVEGLKPVAYTDDEGRFQLTTELPGDGAPAGEYGVSVELREKTRTGVEKVKGRSLLPARYRKPATSGLRFRVENGPNEMPPLTLTDREARP